MITQDEMLIKQRIVCLLHHKQANITKISADDSERIKLGRQINGANKIVSVQTLQKLLSMFPDVSAEWLVMGRGEMIRKDAITHNELHQASNNHGTIQIGNHNSINSDTEALKARIRELENDKQLLQGLLAAFTKK